MTSEFETAFRKMLKSVIREVADELLPERHIMQSTSTQQDGQLLLSGREAAKRLAISEAHLRKLAAAGCIPSVRVGRLVRYSVETITGWIRAAESIKSPKLRPKCVPRKPTAGKVGPKLKRSSAAKRTPSKTARTTTMPKPKRASAAEFRPAEEKPNPFRLLLKEIGVDRDKLGVLTHGELMRIAQVDLSTFHGWMYLGRAMPEEALNRLRLHFK